MIIAIANHKGGTGKTTTTINLGRALAMAGKKILLIDLDPQANMTYSLGLINSQFTIADVLTGTKKVSEVIYERCGMDIIPSGISLNVHSQQLTNLGSSSFLLREKLAEYKAAYDFIFIDCPPSLAVYTINALNAADGLIIPLLLEVLSVQGLDQIINEVYAIQQTTNPGLQIIGALGTIVNENRKLSSEILEYIRDNFALHVFNNHVRSNVKAAEAPSFAETVIDYAPTSASARDYISIANEFLKLLEYNETSRQVHHQPA